ncbi:MAG: hypothetical protein AAGE84_08815 [Cyanobacteria bacterium P01_G01_bin.39]
MVVMIADEQIFSAQQVCQNCLMSDHRGLPRWHGNKLGCGKILHPPIAKQAQVFKCEMGFNVTQVH